MACSPGTLDLGADLKAHRTPREEHDGFCNDSAYRPAMPCGTHSPGPQRTSPARSLGAGGPGWRRVTPRSPTWEVLEWPYTVGGGGGPQTKMNNRDEPQCIRLSQMHWGSSRLFIACPIGHESCCSLNDDCAQTKVTIVGKNEIYNMETLVGPFLVHTLLPPPPPLLIHPPPPRGGMHPQSPAVASGLDSNGGQTGDRH